MTHTVLIVDDDSDIRTFVEVSLSLAGFDTIEAADGEEALAQAVATFADENGREPDTYRHGNTTGGPLPMERFLAAAELLRATGDTQYAMAVEQAFDEATPFFGAIAPSAIAIRPMMNSAYDQRLRAAAAAWTQDMKAARKDNPFGVEITRGGWAGSGSIIGQANTADAIHGVWPDLVSKQEAVSYTHLTLPTIYSV